MTVSSRSELQPRSSHADAQPERASRLGVLRHPAYRLVWCTALASNIGTWMETVGVQWLVASETRSGLVMGALAACHLGPMLALGIVGGVVADRVNRKRLLLATQSVLMLVALALAVTSAMGWASTRVLLALTLANGIAAAFNIPAWQVLTPRLVPRAELSRAIALNSVQFNLARVIGPALGGLILAWSGPTALFFVNAASFVGMVVAVALTPDSPAPSADGRRAWALVGEAMRFVAGHRGTRALFLGEIIFAGLAAPVLRLLALFVGEVHRAGEGLYGVMLSLMGAGAVLGGISLRFVPRWYPRHHLIPLGVAGCGASIALFSAAPTPVLAAVPMLLVGVFWLWCFSSFSAAVHLLVTDAMRGRVMSIYNTGVFGAMPIGILVAAAMGEVAARAASHAGDAIAPGLVVQAGVGLSGVALAVVGLVMIVWRTPEIDGLNPDDPTSRRRPGLFAGVTASAHRPARGEASSDGSRTEPTPQGFTGL